MSEKLPSREEALEFLRKSGCQPNVLKHCEAVAALALEMAEAAKKKDLGVDLKLVEVGALLHDIGRGKTHSVHHAIIGAQIAESLGLPRPVVSIIKRHVGGGITNGEARKLGWPKGIYVPQTLEEKIVSYADKLIEGSRRVPIDITIQGFSRELPRTTIERLQRLHREMVSLIGDCKCLP